MFCSDECRRESDRVRIAGYRASRPKAEKRASKPPRERHCARCGQCLQADSSSKKWAKYCTEECQRQASKERAALRPTRRRPARPKGGHPARKGICAACGEPFIYHQARPQQACSKKCANQLRHAGRACPIDWRTCVDCGALWTVRPNSEETNCPRCRRLLASAITAVHRAAMAFKRITDRPVYQPHDHVCPVCQSAFKGHGSAIYCSKPCQRKSPAEKAARTRRRMRKRAAVVEEFEPSDVFTRDQFRCGICKKRLEMDKRVPHPKAPTIDHILPLSRGGQHTLANVRAAHFICNSKRGAVGAAQLRLA